MNINLNKSVAEKLGLVECSKWQLWGTGLSGGEYTNSGCEHKFKCYPKGQIRHYDTEWGITGPVIQRLGICICVINPNFPESKWFAGLQTPAGSGPCSIAATPLIAVCNLILSLTDEQCKTT
jgi:hypothetical protein